MPELMRHVPVAPIPRSRSTFNSFVDVKRLSKYTPYLNLAVGSLEIKYGTTEAVGFVLSSVGSTTFLMNGLGLRIISSLLGML